MQVTVNGQVPGPAIRVKKNDWVEVTVTNKIADGDFTTVHWHGMEQRGTPYSDGVPAITQCLIAQETTMVYTFLADRGGTFWYHGHYSEQYPDGLYGSLIIDDDDHATFAAAGAPYAVDSDVWTWLIADWYNVPATSLLPQYLSPPSGGDEPMPDAYVVNNLFAIDDTIAIGTNNFVIRADKTAGSVRVRVANVAALSMFVVSVDGMPLTVIEVDGTSVAPMDLSEVSVNVAQRVSFVLDWSRMDPSLQASPAIWIRVQSIEDMYPTFNASLDGDGLIGSSSGLPILTHWKGLIRFDDNPTSVPSYTLPPVSSLSPAADSNMLAARPLVPDPAPPPTHVMEMLVVFQPNDAGVNLAYINGETFPPMALPVTSNLLDAYLNPAVMPSPDPSSPVGGG